MELEIVYRNRQISIKDITYIKDLIADNPGKSRWFISRELCQQWDWRQPNEALKDMVCRGLLLKLEKDGLLSLPPRLKIITIRVYLGYIKETKLRIKGGRKMLMKCYFKDEV